MSLLCPFPECFHAYQQYLYDPSSSFFRAFVGCDPSALDAQAYLLNLAGVSSGSCVQVLLGSALVMLGCMLPY